MTSYNKKKVNGTYVCYTTQYAWAEIDGLGWKRIKDESPDGVSNMFILLCTAKASSRKVNIETDSGGLITCAYLL